jgi:hypothetical protein
MESCRLPMFPRMSAVGATFLFDDQKIDPKLPFEGQL